MAKVILTIPGGRRKTFNLDKPKIFVGRAPKCEIVLDDKKCSRKHLQINFAEGVITVEDLGSSNGTLFMGEKIKTKQLADRDTLTIGDNKLQFFFDDNAVPDVAVSKKKRTFEEAAKDKSLVKIQLDGSIVDVEGDVFYLEVLDGSLQGLKISLTDTLTIGRHPQNQLVLDGIKVSAQHAVINFKENGFYITDLESTNGVILNTKKIKPNAPELLMHKAIISIGDHRMMFIFPTQMRPPEPPKEALPTKEEELSALASHSLIFIGGKLKGQRIQMTKRITIGRKDFNNLCLDSDKVSGEHSEIIYDKEQFSIRDLGSTNGTFINGRKLKAKHILTHGDVINIGDYVLVFEEAGQTLDLDVRVKRIKAVSTKKIVKALFVSSIVFICSVILLYIFTDIIVTNLKISPIQTERSTVKIESGVEFNNNTIFQPMPEFSFEYSKDLKNQIPGWDIISEDRACDWTFDKTIKYDGNWSLVVIPKKTTDPRAEIKIRTQHSINAKMKNLLQEQGIQASVCVYAENLEGVVGLRIIWNPDNYEKGETMRWVSKDGFKSINKDGIQKPAWIRLTNPVAIPANVEEFSIELFCRGDVGKVWWDRVLVTSGKPEFQILHNPIKFKEINATEDVTCSKPVQLEFAEPAKGKIARDNIIVATDLAPVLLCNADNTGLKNSGSETVQFFEFLTPDDMPPLRLGQIQNQTFAYAIDYFSQQLKNLLSFELEISVENDYGLVRPILTSAEPAKGEIIALKLNLIEPLFTSEYHLRLFNKNNDSFVPVSESGFANNCAELCWGNYSGYTSLRMNSEGKVFFKKNKTGYLIYILLKGEDISVTPASIEIRGYSYYEWKLKMSVFRDALSNKASPSKHGDALIQFLRLIQAFSKDADFVKMCKKHSNELEREKDELITSVNESFNFMKSEPASDGETLGKISKGIAAAREFNRRFKSLVEVRDDIQNKLAMLIEGYDKFKDALTENEKLQRQAQAVLLLTQARKFADPENPNYSTLKAHLYLKAILDRYSDTTIKQEAQRLIDLIEADWNNTAKEQEFVEKEIIAIKNALKTKDIALAQRIASNIYKRYPFTSYRKEIENLLK